MQVKIPKLTVALDEIEYFEREQTDRDAVELAILLHNHGVSLHKVKRVLGWIGVELLHEAIWKWVQKFRQRLEEAGRWSPPNCQQLS